MYKFMLAPILCLTALFAGMQDAGDPLDNARRSYARSDFADAKTLLLQALEKIETGPPEDPKRYDILKLLSRTHWALREYPEAQQRLDEAVQWLESHTNGDQRLAEDLTERAMMSRALKDFGQAMAILMRVGNLTRSDPVKYADNFSRLALVQLDMQKPDEAVSLLRMAIAIREQATGMDHPSLVADLDRLGATLVTRRYYDQAEMAFRRVLRIREQLVGHEHADLLQTLDGLAYALFGQQKFEDAEVVYQRLLKLWVSSAGGDHPMAAITLDKIATFYREQKKFEQGDQAAASAVAIRGGFHAEGLQQEATDSLAREKADEAIALLQRAACALGEARPEHAKQREIVEHNLKALRAPAFTCIGPPAEQPAPVKKNTGRTKKN